MSRVAKSPIEIPAGVDVTITGQSITVKGGKGELFLNVHESVIVGQDDNLLKVTIRVEGTDANALAGTTRSLVNNMVAGVSHGFEKKLTLIGVGYRAQAQGKTLNLALGFSHPVVFAVPEGINIETPSQTEVVVKGIDKQKVGQVAADIRAFRPPEPYKGKGVRYADEHVVRKEAKKK
ncbi:MAG: 50S ribosomal protein L6 [Gammaproteobacteria bacterium]|nr:50S ribosomal protein L6 [Gammaproteobacteria bacterium]